jgi:hypothetical protein
MINDTSDPMSSFVPLVLTQPGDRVCRVSAFARSGSSLAICSAVKRAFHGTIDGHPWDCKARNS